MSTNYSFYPFLNGAKRPIQSINDQCILYARKNIEKYSPTNILELDLSVFLISTIILRNLNNNFLTRKFVSNFGKFFESRFTKDIHDREIRMQVLEYFGVYNKDLGKTFVRNEFLFRIHMTDYLEIQQDRHGAPRLSLVNQVLEKGFVVIELQRFVYLLRLAFEHRLYDKIKNKMKVYEENESINKVVKELKPLYEQKEEYIKIKNTGIPESIKALIEKARTTHHLEHHERIKVGIAMQARGCDIEEIVDVFRLCSDFDEKVTRYQLKSLQRYITKPS